jgi:outer membrane protein assembly factor BamB
MTNIKKLARFQVRYIALFLLLVLTIPMIVQTSQMTVQAIDVPTFLKVYAAPNPVGLGQVEFLSMFFTKPISTVGNQIYRGLTLIVVKPDGTNQTFGPYNTDTTGGVGGIEFTPTALGNYTIQGFFPGHDLPGGYYVEPAISEPAYFTVQQDIIPGFPWVPLPTEYWSRPIYSTNFEWAQLGGNWWGLGKPSFTDTGGYDATGNNFNAYSTAPNSAHIMWVQPVAFGGQPGLPVSGDQESQYTSSSILYRQFEPVILNGIIFYKLYPNTPTTMTYAEKAPGLAAVDLRTGEELWRIETNEIIAFGWTMQFHTIQEYGTQAFLVTGFNSSMWRLRDPTTGYVIANITNVPSITLSGIVETRDDSTQGSVLYHSLEGNKLTLWNFTRCLMSSASASTIRPSGNINFTRGNMWTKDIVNKTSDGASLSLSISGRTEEYLVLRQSSNLASQSGAGWAVEAGYDARTGDLLWGPVNRTYPIFHEVSRVAIGEKWYVSHDKDTNEAYVYSLETGKQIGATLKLEGNNLGYISRGAAIAYGKCFIWDFGGNVYAIDLETGTLSWAIVPPSTGYATPYGVNPIWHFGSHSIADGKLFLSEGRMYDPPMFPGAHKLAINVTDGSIIWSVLGFYGREPSAIADGYMVGYNSYDAQIYVWGKGPTSTTATITQDVLPFGTGVLIKGTVTDISAGTADDDRSARFANGVAAVSEESQQMWMEYVYMQQPKPDNATGVLVDLYVIDSNNNYRPIGTTTTDTNGMYSLLWTPDIEGKYTVVASFGGSESYWPSQATTAFAVDPAAPTPTPSPIAKESIADQYFVPAIAGLFVAIIVIGVVLALLLLKKRP